jgi:hypothetical protein
MIERIYFYLIIFSQKEMGSEKHMADVVVPDRLGPFCHTKKRYDF